MRVVDRGVAQGRMQHCAINAPASKTGDQPQHINVILKPDIKLDEDYLLVNEVSNMCDVTIIFLETEGSKFKAQWA